MQAINLSFPTHIIAHRGASALAPENTLAAFRKASELGAKWVEFDVMLAGCGEVIVIHDKTLDRTTNGSGLVSDYPYQYLQTLDAGTWFDSQFKGEKIPTLAEVIDTLHEYQLAANIEIKPALGQEIETVQRVLQVIDTCWRPDMSAPLISSFSPRVLECVRQKSKKHFLSYFMGEWHDDWEKYCDAFGCISVNVKHTILNQARIAEIKKTKRFVLSYTVDEFQLAERLWTFGVDAIFSNCPPQMKDFF